MLVYQEKHSFPLFCDHVEAIEYFKSRYGHRFTVINASQHHHRNLYFCYLGLYGNRTQSIIIFNNGKVIIIY